MYRDFTAVSGAIMLRPIKGGKLQLFHSFTSTQLLPQTTAQAQAEPAAGSGFCSL